MALLSTARLTIERDILVFMDVYSLNPNILPGDPLIQEHHHRMVVVGLILACIIVLGAFLVWKYTSTGTPVIIAPHRVDQRSAMAALLRQNVVPVSAEEINNMASLLSKSKTTVTATERETMAASLRDNVPQQ